MLIFLLLSLFSLSFGFLEVANRDKPHVPDEYVITYHLNTTDADAQSHWNLMALHEVEFLHRYNVGFHKGFAAKITDPSVITQLQNDPLVMAIEMNCIVELNQKTCTGFTDKAASWGLSRVSFAGSISGGLIDDFYYDTGAYSGAGTTVYIIDTGILTTHVDFEGRASWGVSYAPGGPIDDNGHGTHCAGTAVGATYGIAKQARVVAVKVLDSQGSGTIANVISGIDWTTFTATPFKSVASLSLGAPGVFSSLTVAVNNCVAKGIPVVVAAGNSNDDACDYSPAGIPSTICVGATELGGAAPSEFDARAYFSNYGSCVHIFAPGRNIVSAWIGSNTASLVNSGTSMACPHVAGQAACILSSGNNISPQEVKTQLQSTAQKDYISSVGAGSPNYLLYNECMRT